MKPIYTVPKVFLSILLMAILVFGFQNDSKADQFEEAVKLFESEDYAGAIQIFKGLAEKGNGFAQYSLGFHYDLGYGIEKDDEEAVKWYRKAAEQGIAEAQYSLGYIVTKLAKVWRKITSRRLCGFAKPPSKEISEDNTTSGRCTTLVREYLRIIKRL